MSIKLGWASYALVMVCALPLVSSQNVAPQVGAIPSTITPLDATDSTSGSNGPPLPTCGSFVRDETFGPVTVSQLWTQSCANIDSSKPYLQQSLKKIKHIYQNGSIWECPVSPLDNAACSAFDTNNCPSGTCAK